MGKPFETYVMVEIESLPKKTSGLHGPVHIRPVEGRPFPSNMHVRCSKSLSEEYPVGTRFRIRAKLTDKGGSAEFLHSHHNWPYEVLSKPPHK
jgi:hypothetical protein